MAQMAWIGLDSLLQTRFLTVYSRSSGGPAGLVGLASVGETSTIFHPPHWGGFYSGVPGVWPP